MLTGGRGKAGGIKLADDPADAEQNARDILGLDIRGHVVRRLWIERASDIAREYYLSVTFDRGAKKPLFMLTTEGGVDIEEVAANTPTRSCGSTSTRSRAFSRTRRAGSSTAPASRTRRAEADHGDHRAPLRRFVDCDAMLCEINPLIVTPDGEVKALDSKFSVDDNALYKHPDIAEMRDPEADPPEERAAREKGVTYVKLDGDVGVLGNGAGLSMSTVDVVTFVGGRPANFCDLGGGGDAEGVVDALEVITGDPQVSRSSSTSSAGSRAATRSRGASCRRSSSWTSSSRSSSGSTGRTRRRGADPRRRRPANIHPEATMLDGARRAVELAA